MSNIKLGSDVTIVKRESIQLLQETNTPSRREAFKCNSVMPSPRGAPFELVATCQGERFYVNARDRNRMLVECENCHTQYTVESK